MYTMNTQEVFDFIKRKTNCSRVEIIVPWNLMKYDRVTNNYLLLYNDFEKNVMQIGMVKYTGHELSKFLRRHLDCESVLIEIKIDNNDVLERTDDSEWGFLKKLQINVHVSFNDEVIYDKFIQEGMMDFAFMTKDRNLFLELTRNKKDKV